MRILGKELTEQGTIIYSIEPDHIRIIAVSHTKRKPEYWVNRA